MSLYPEHDKLGKQAADLWVVEDGISQDGQSLLGNANARPWRQSDESNYQIGPFLEWLQNQVVFARWAKVCPNCEALADEDQATCFNPECDEEDLNYVEPQLVPVHRGLEDWLASYYGINRQRLNSEKEAMLELQRAHNAVYGLEERIAKASS